MENRRRCVLLLLQIILIAGNCFARKLMLDINLKRPIAVTSDAFLSLTLDPETLLSNIDDLTENMERSSNLARSLAPAYVRLAGAQSNIFEQADPDDVATNRSSVSPEMYWTLMHRWAENAGLDVIVCVAPRFIEAEPKTHSRHPAGAAEFLSFSDRMGYNTSWQLGYECQTRCEYSAGDLGRYVAKLRDLLKTYPRYSNSLIIGPDIVAYRTMQEQRYLQDYFNSADDALSAITWHPNFAGVSFNSGNISLHHDNLAVEMNEIYQIIGRAAANKPLWIAESKPEEHKHQQLGALIWTRRLGDAAKLGVPVLMRQPQYLNRATPDYWVSLLHKTLVGREVFETKIQHSRSNNVHFYSQCTKPSALYDKGALTIFGVNLTPGTVTANVRELKIGALHKYILSSDSETADKMFSEKVLLNDKPLDLIDDREIPSLHPEIVTGDNLEIELSSGNIGFWVIPDAEVKACMYSEEETIMNSAAKRLSKRHEETIQQGDQDKREKNTIQNSLKGQKAHTKQDRRQSKIITNKNQQDIWNNKLLGRIARVLQKRLQRQEKSDPSDSRRSVTIDLKERQEASSEDERTKDDVRNVPKKHKRSLLGEKDQMESRYAEDPITERLDNAVTSKIGTLFLDKEEVTSNESINKIEDEIRNEEKLMAGINEKLKKYLYMLGNFSERTSIVEKLKRYFDKLLDTLEDNKPTKNEENNRILIQKNSMKEKRSKRDLKKISENSKEAEILGKRSRIDDLRNHLAMRKLERKNFYEKKRTSDNPSKNYKDEDNRLLRQRKPVLEKRFLENEVSKIRMDHQVARQKFKTESNKREQKNINHSKIVEDRQSSTQKLERARREIIGKKLAEVGARKENILRKRSRADDVKDYLNERKTRKKDDREGLLVPFNPRATESDENTFYGFFRRQPIDNFPKGDVFVIAGDSLEQNGKDYDYVEDENDDVDSLAQNAQTSTLDCMEDNAWAEPQMEDDHNDHTTNEFFEKVKSSDGKIREGSGDYDDLWAAQYLSEEQERKNAKGETEDGINYDKRSIAEILRMPYERAGELEREYIRDMSTQYDDQNAKYSNVGPKHFSPIFEQPDETRVYVNPYVSNARAEEAKVKLDPQVSFYQPARVFIARYNYGNQQASKHDEGELSGAKDSVVNMSDDTRTTNFYKPAISNGIPQNGRVKRSNWDKLKVDLAREMIEEDESNAEGCHCRVIRASDTPKKVCYCRVKRDDQVLDSSSDVGDADDTDGTYFARDVRNLMTTEDYEKIMTGEILPSVYNSYEPNVAEEAVAAKSSEVDHGSRNMMQMRSDALPNDSSMIHIPKQSDDAERSIVEPLLADSTLSLSLSNDNSVKDIAKETFFRAQPANIQTENETYDSPQTDHSTYSGNRKDLLPSSITGASQKTTREKKEAVVDEKKEETRTSTHSTITAYQKDEEWHEDNYTSSLKTIVSAEEITKELADGTTTETSLSKRATDKLVNDSASNEMEAKQKLQRKSQEGSKKKSTAEERRSRLTKDPSAGKLPNMFQSLPKTPLRELSRIEENLIKRAQQIDKRKEKLYAKREKLLQQYRRELSQIADEQKRNLKRRDAWERFRENDDFRQLIGRSGEFIGILVDESASCEYDEDYSDEEKHGRRYVIPIELTSKQYDALLDRIYPFVRKERYPNRSQLLRQLKLLEDEQESAESGSVSDRGIFIIDPSTYYGGEPTLQLHKDNVKSSKYHSQIQSQMQIPKWILKNFYQDSSKKSEKTQQPIFKLREYAKKSPIRDYHDRETADVLYVLDAQKQPDLLKELARIWLNSIDERDVNRVARNKAQAKSSTMYKNLEENHDCMTDEETESAIDSDTERNTENVELVRFDDGEENTRNFRTIKDAKEIAKKETFEEMRLTRDMKTERDINNERSANVHNKKEDVLNIRKTKDLKDVEENPDNNKEEIAEINTRSRKIIARTRRLNKKNKIKNAVEDKDNTEISKSYNSNEAKEKLDTRMSNNNGIVDGAEIEPNELEEGTVRIRRDVEHPRNNKHLEQAPYFLRKNTRNGPNYDIYIYSKKNSEETLNKRPVQYSFLRKLSDSMDDDNFSQDFQVPVGSLRQKAADLTDKSSEELEDLQTLLHLINLLNKTAKDVSSTEEISSGSEQNISLDDENTAMNYRSSKEDEKCGSRNVESDEYVEVRNKMRSYNPTQSRKCGMVLLLPRRDEKRQRRQVESEINENADQIESKKPKKYKSTLAENEDKSAKYRNSNANKINRKITKTRNLKGNYLRLDMDGRDRDDILEDFMEARKNNNLRNNEVSYLTRDKDSDKDVEDNIWKSDGKTLPLPDEPIPALENLIIEPEMRQDLTKSAEQLIDNFEEKYKETSTLDKHSRNETLEINDNDLSVGFINKLFTFFSEIPRIFMYKSRTT